MVYVLQPLLERFAVAPVDNANPFSVLFEAPTHLLGSLEVEALLLDRVGGCHGGAVVRSGSRTVGLGGVVTGAPPGVTLSYLASAPPGGSTPATCLSPILLGLAAPSSQHVLNGHYWCQERNYE